MPFKSKAQAGYMHSHPEILGKAGLKEWDAATKGKHLPERVMAKKSKHGRPKHTHVEHHEDGSHTVKHDMGDGKSVGHGMANDADLMAHMQDALSGQAAEPEAPAAAAPMAPVAA